MSGLQFCSLPVQQGEESYNSSKETSASVGSLGRFKKKKEVSFYKLIDIKLTCPKVVDYLS